jgi:diadenosine tetraphosphate (Ap4A) HIT family hydrolase
VPETPQEFYERAAGALRTPPVEDWESWPFRGSVAPKALEAPVEHERPRHGEGGVDCRRCATPDDEYAWTNEHWRLYALDPPNGLPIVLLLEPREHLDAPGDLSEDMAAELGVLIGRIDRAIMSVPGIGRVHVGRWGEGGAHLHIWFMARPAGFEQLRSNFAAVWDDVLPAMPREIWDENVRLVVAALEAGA